MIGVNLGMRRLAWTVALTVAMGGYIASPPPATAAERHGISAFGDLKYPADFKHFDYVNPDAPKGGRLALVGTGGRLSFDSFNGYILKGDAAQGLSLLFENFSLIFDSLMTRAHDEPDALYGLVARTADIADDGRSVIFRLRPEARFADGTALTAADVVFSFETLKAKGHPSYKIMLRDVRSAEAIDPLAVRYSFDAGNRDLPLVVGELPIFSKAYYANREFDQTTLDPPLGSGAYAIAEFRPGRFVSYKRRPDYWAKDLPVRRGVFNFDEVRYEYFRDRTAALENLKAGAFDLREEFTAKDWATSYNIPQVADGRIVRATLPDGRPSGAQGWFMNTRRAKFQDIRVRQAIGLMFDFEWSNKNLFFNLYKRSRSIFENSPMMASGPPSPAELALLEPFKAKLLPTALGEPVLPPVSDASGADRKLLSQAAKLLEESGYTIKAGKRVGPTGEPLTLEFLISSEGFERIIQPYIKTLELLGIAASIRLIDPAQYEQRLKTFDFDLAVQRYVMRLTPGVELSSYLASEQAAIDGSFNLAGVRDPVVDAMLNKIVSARTRDELNTATRALDRVLRAGYYWVPHWFKASHTLAYWDRFGQPATKPAYDDGIVHTWWYDAAKDVKLKAR